MCRFLFYRAWTCSCAHAQETVAPPTYTIRRCRRSTERHTTRNTESGLTRDSLLVVWFFVVRYLQSMSHRYKPRFGVSLECCTAVVLVRFIPSSCAHKLMPASIGAFQAGEDVQYSTPTAHVVSATRFFFSYFPPTAGLCAPSDTFTEAHPSHGAPRCGQRSRRGEREARERIVGH